MSIIEQTLRRLDKQSDVEDFAPQLADVAGEFERRPKRRALVLLPLVIAVAAALGGGWWMYSGRESGPGEPAGGTVAAANGETASGAPGTQEAAQETQAADAAAQEPGPAARSADAAEQEATAGLRSGDAAAQAGGPAARSGDAAAQPAAPLARSGDAAAQGTAPAVRSADAATHGTAPGTRPADAAMPAARSADTAAQAAAPGAHSAQAGTQGLASQGTAPVGGTRAAGETAGAGRFPVIRSLPGGPTAPAAASMPAVQPESAQAAQAAQAVAPVRAGEPARAGESVRVAEPARAEAPVARPDWQRTAPAWIRRGADLFRKGRRDDAFAIWRESIAAVPPEHMLLQISYYTNEALAWRTFDDLSRTFPVFLVHAPRAGATGLYLVAYAGGEIDEVMRGGVAHQLGNDAAEWVSAAGFRSALSGRGSQPRAEEAGPSRSPAAAPAAQASARRGEGGSQTARVPAEPQAPVASRLTSEPRSTASKRPQGEAQPVAAARPSGEPQSAAASRQPRDAPVAAALRPSRETAPAAVHRRDDGRGPAADEAAQRNAAGSLRKAESLVAGGQYVEALFELRTLAPEGRENWMFHYLAGIAEMRLGRQDQALSALNEAHRLSPERPQPLIQRAVLNQERRDHNAALTDLRRAMELAPKMPEIHLNIGYSADALGRTKEAVDAYGRFIDLSASQAGYASSRQWVSKRLRDLVADMR